ncbi:hypothetical protein, partial [Streptomyces hebeiensis]|uniref:hypothetical protein n=1 Tax=Streptomyces hebeiensis TaxID=229486 RepID=UPI0031E01AB2
MTAPKGSTSPDLSSTDGLSDMGLETDVDDDASTGTGQDGTREVQNDSTDQEDLPGRGTSGRNTSGQPGLEDNPNQQVQGAPPESEAESGSVAPPAPISTSTGPNAAAPAQGTQGTPPGAPQGTSGTGNQSQQSSQTDLTDRNDPTDLTDLPDQQTDQDEDRQQELSDGTERSLTPPPPGVTDDTVTDLGTNTNTNTTGPDGAPAPPPGLRTSSDAPRLDESAAPPAPPQPAGTDLAGGPRTGTVGSDAPTGDATPDSTSTDTSTDTDTVANASTRTPELAVPVADPVRPEQWRAGRHDAPPVPVRTERIDPAPDLDPGQNSGQNPGPGPRDSQETLVRMWVQRIQADDGRWMSNVSLHLPVRAGEGFAQDELAAFQNRIQTLLNSRLNNGLLLPESGDQLHIDLTLTSVPGHSEAIELSRTPRPDDSDQLNWRLHTVDPAASPEETAERQARDDAAVLHKLLNYAGVPDRGREAEAVLRRLVRQSDSHDLMADPGRQPDPAPAVPLRYLGTIEDVIQSVTGTDASVIDHPLSARGTRPPSGMDDPVGAPQMLAPDQSDPAGPIVPPAPVRTASTMGTASVTGTDQEQSDTDPPPAPPATAPALDETPPPPTNALEPGMGRGTGQGLGASSGAGKGKGRSTDFGPDSVGDATPADITDVTDTFAVDLAIDEAREEHDNALAAFNQAVRTAGILNQRVESGQGGTDDAARLYDAWQDVEHAQRRLDAAVDRLRDLGADAAVDAAVAAIVPRVSRTDAERQLTAALVTADDLPDDPPRLALDDTVTKDQLTAAGITLNDGPGGLQLALNGFVSVRDSGLDVVGHVRLLMNRPGPWTDTLDGIAARAARRTWRDAYGDFAIATFQASGVPAGTDPAEAWRRATSLVLPLELHPVLADSRHARGDLLAAVRQVAEHLAVHGADALSGVELAGRVRRELGLPPRLLGGAPGSSPTVVGFDAGSSSVGRDERRELKALASGVASAGLLNLRAGLSAPEVVLTGFGRSGRSARDRV